MCLQAKECSRLPRKQSEAQRGVAQAVRETGYTHSMILHFESPEWWEHKFLIVQATPLVVYHYNSSGNTHNPTRLPPLSGGSSWHLTAFDDSKPSGGRMSLAHHLCTRDLRHRAGLHCTSERTHVDLWMSPDSRRASHEQSGGHVARYHFPESAGRDSCEWVRAGVSSKASLPLVTSKQAGEEEH